MQELRYQYVQGQSDLIRSRCEMRVKASVSDDEGIDIEMPTTQTVSRIVVGEVAKDGSARYRMDIIDAGTDGNLVINIDGESSLANEDRDDFDEQVRGSVGHRHYGVMDNRGRMVSFDIAESDQLHESLSMLMGAVMSADGGSVPVHAVEVGSEWESNGQFVMMGMRLAVKTTSTVVSVDEGCVVISHSGEVTHLSGSLPFDYEGDLADKLLSCTGVVSGTREIDLGRVIPVESSSDMRMDFVFENGDEMVAMVMSVKITSSIVGEQ